MSYAVDNICDSGNVDAEVFGHESVRLAPSAPTGLGAMWVAIRAKIQAAYSFIARFRLRFDFVDVVIDGPPHSVLTTPKLFHQCAVSPSAAAGRFGVAPRCLVFSVPAQNLTRVGLCQRASVRVRLLSGACDVTAAQRVCFFKRQHTGPFVAPACSCITTVCLRAAEVEMLRRDARRCVAMVADQFSRFRPISAGQIIRNFMGKKLALFSVAVDDRQGSVAFACLGPAEKNAAGIGRNLLAPIKSKLQLIARQVGWRACDSKTIANGEVHRIDARSVGAVAAHKNSACRQDLARQPHADASGGKGLAPGAIADGDAPKAVWPHRPRPGPAIAFGSLVNMGPKQFFYHTAWLAKLLMGALAGAFTAHAATLQRTPATGNPSNRVSAHVQSCFVAGIGYLP